MEVNNLSNQNSILNHFVSELRNINVHGDSLRFRKNLERIGEILAYEISKKLNYELTEIQTPLGIAPTFLFKNKIVLATILRAGLPLHEGFLHYFDNSQNAFISASRRYNENHTSFEILVEYISSPRIEGKTLIIIDPMLATGSSLQLVFNSLLKKGEPEQIHIACAIASQYGIENITKSFPINKTTIWTAAIDPEINDKAYIIPGLGDAGDLAFGIKE